MKVLEFERKVGEKVGVFLMFDDEFEKLKEIMKKKGFTVHDLRKEVYAGYKCTGEHHEKCLEIDVSDVEERVVPAEKMIEIMKKILCEEEIV